MMCRGGESMGRMLTWAVWILLGVGLLALGLSSLLWLVVATGAGEDDALMTVLFTVPLLLYLFWIGLGATLLGGALWVWKRYRRDRTAPAEERGS